MAINRTHIAGESKSTNEHVSTRSKMELFRSLIFVTLLSAPATAFGELRTDLPDCATATQQAADNPDAAGWKSTMCRCAKLKKLYDEDTEATDTYNQICSDASATPPEARIESHGPSEADKELAKSKAEAEKRLKELREQWAKTKGKGKSKKKEVVPPPVVAPPVVAPPVVPPPPPIVTAPPVVPPPPPIVTAPPVVPPPPPVTQTVPESDNKPTEAPLDLDWNLIVQILLGLAGIETVFRVGSGRYKSALEKWLASNKSLAKKLKIPYDPKEGIDSGFPCLYGSIKAYITNRERYRLALKEHKRFSLKLKKK